MKKNVGLPLIIGAVVVVGLLIFGMSRAFFRGSPTTNPEYASKIPDYARQSQSGQAPSYKPNTPQAGGAGATGPSGPNMQQQYGNPGAGGPPGPPR